VELSYVGSAGDSLIRHVDINRPQPADVVQLGGENVARPFLGYGAITMRETTARSRYHGLLFNFRHDAGRAGLLNVSYTLSRANTDSTNDRDAQDIPQNTQDRDAEYGPARTDRTHIFNVNYVYELPFFRDAQNALLKAVLGGWQVSGITAYQSGRPFTIWTGVDTNGDGTTGSDRPNMNGGCGVSWDADHRNFTNNGCYVVPLGSNNLPLANSLGDGNAPRNNERFNGYWTTDLSLLKRFYVFGERQLIIRADAFNAFNQDNYGASTTIATAMTNLSSTSFGQNPGGTAANGWGRRIITLSAKFSF
jgi:hypothetical protein